MALDPLPAELRYLSGYLEFIVGLPPEEADDELDAPILDEALHTITEHYGEHWRPLLRRDVLLLRGWLERTAPANDNAYAAIPFLERFERGQKTLGESFHEARQSKSGLFLSPALDGVAVADEFSKLSLTWDDGTSFELTLVDEDDYGFELENIEHHRGQNENRIEELHLGAWKGTRLLLQSSVPFFWKQAEYFLAGGSSFVVGTATRGGDRDFDPARIDEAVKSLQPTRENEART